MGPTWGPSGADRTQVGPMLAPWTLLSGWSNDSFNCVSIISYIDTKCHFIQGITQLRQVGYIMCEIRYAEYRLKEQNNDMHFKSISGWGMQIHLCKTASITTSALLLVLWKISSWDIIRAIIWMSVLGVFYSHTYINMIKINHSIISNSISWYCLMEPPKLIHNRHDLAATATDMKYRRWIKWDYQYRSSNTYDWIQIDAERRQEMLATVNTSFHSIRLENYNMTARN